MKTVKGGDRSPPHTHTLLNSTTLLSSYQEKLWQVCENISRRFVFNVFLVYTIIEGLPGVMYSSSRLSGRVQRPFLVESRGSRRYYFSPVPGFLLCCCRLADSFSSTTSLQPRGLTAGQTPISCFFSMIYTQRAESSSIHYKQGAHSKYIRPSWRRFLLPAQRVGPQYHRRNLPRQLLATLVQKSKVWDNGWDLSCWQAARQG